MNRLLLISLLAVCFCSGWSYAQEKKLPPPGPKPVAGPDKVDAAPQLPPEAHPWGRFPVGSWKTVRMTTESLDSMGRIATTSIIEIKTTLIAADDLEYQVKTETTVDVGGKRFPQAPQTTRYSYWGDLNKPAAGLQKVGTAEVEVNGKKVPCELRQAVNESTTERRQSVVHYAASQFPYILKRETSVTPAKGTGSHTTVEVVAANLPQRVMGVLRSVAYVRTVNGNPKGSSTTMEIQSADIPGGVVSHSAQERDPSEAVTRRTTLELLDYGVGAETPEQASPYRRRYFRSRNRRDEPRRDR